MTKSELTIIKLALTEVVRARVEKVKSLPPAPFPTSDSFNKAMVDLINERKARQLRVIQIRKAVAIAIIAALVLSFAACCIIYREEIKGFFVDMYDNHGKLSSSETNKSFNIDMYTPIYIPTGYLLNEQLIGASFIQSTWSSESNCIILMQSPDLKSEIVVDSEDEAYSTICLQDITLYYTHKKDTILIIWRQYDSIFNLSCPDDIPWNEIENMILSLKLVE